MGKAPPPLRDTHVGDQSITTNALMAGLPGAILGALLGVFLWMQGSPWWMVPLCAVVVAAAVGGTALFLTRGAGKVGGALHMPSSGSTPRPKEYSQAESLVARGRYAEAVTAFELAVLEDPTDPTPYLRVARIHRDHLAEPEHSLRWFRRALRESDAPRGAAFLTIKELVELATRRMGAPERALPELARLSEQWAGSPEGDWVAETLQEIKRGM